MQPLRLRPPRHAGQVPGVRHRSESNGMKRPLLNLLTLGVRASRLGFGWFLVVAVGGDVEVREPPFFTVLYHVPHLRLDELLELREQAAHAPAAGGAGGGLAPANPPAALHPQRELVEKRQHDNDDRDDEEYGLKQLSAPCPSLGYDPRVCATSR